MKATGGCHCGAVRFEVNLPEPLVVLECNCSICTPKGFLHVLVAKQDFQLLTDPAAMRTYTFGTHVAQHHFCGTCGIHAFYVPRSHPGGFDVNLRALDDPPHHHVQPFDGKHWEQAILDIHPEQ